MADIDAAAVTDGWITTPNPPESAVTQHTITLCYMGTLVTERLTMIQERIPYNDTQGEDIFWKNEKMTVHRVIDLLVR